MGGCDLLADRRHGSNGHRLVALVIEEKRGAAFGVVSDNAFEHDDGAVFRCENTLAHGGNINGVARQGEVVAGLIGSAADGGKKCDLVAFRDRSGRCGKLLVTGNHDTGPESSKTRKT